MTWDSKLRQLGYRITPQRQLVLEAIEELKHATPEQILVAVSKKMNGINLPKNSLEILLLSKKELMAQGIPNMEFLLLLLTRLFQVKLVHL